MMDEYIINRILEFRDEFIGKRVLFQLPEGLKYLIPKIKEICRDAVFSGENVYGACDIGATDGYDIVVHIGHSKIPNIRYSEKVIFFEPRFRVSSRVLSLSTSLPHKRIGIAATVEFIDSIEYLKNILVEHGKECYIGVGGSRLSYPGQVLGCNYSSLKSIADYVDCFLVLSSGEFHPLGAYLATKKPTYYFNPICERIVRIEDVSFIKKRFGRIVKAQEAESFGILLSRKIGQRREELAAYLDELVRSASLKSYLFEIDEVSPEKLMNLPVDAIVNTCCPRLTYDDTLEKRCGKIIISPQELEITLRVRRWEEYTIDEID